MVTGAPERHTRPVGMPQPGVVRDPLGVWLLTLVTLGVYAVVHHFLINRELRAFGVDVDPRLSALAFFPGVALVVPFFVTVYRTGRRIAVAQEAEELLPRVFGFVSVLSTCCFFVGSAYHQAQANKVWQLRNSTKGDT